MDAEELYYKLKDDVEAYLGLNELSDEGDELLAEFCRKLVGDVPSEDPNRDYQMFTPEGNKAVANMVVQVASFMRGGTVTRLQLPDALRAAMDVVAETYPEIFDTEPRGEISHRISVVCDQLGWKGVDL